MMTFTRKRQTFLLILLTAATLMPSYSLQGWLAGGHSASELPFWFWIWETVAWSARALIEAGAILFLFETNAQTHTQERALFMFKVMLIALITLTLGVVVASAGLGQSIADALPRPLYWLWSFAVASYAPLMLGSVGMAYRIQPHDTSSMPQDEPVVASKPVIVSSPKPTMTQRRKETVSSEPVASLPKTVASSEVVSSEIVASLPIAVASSEVVAAKSSDVELDTKLWDELKSDEARWAYYQERKSMKLSDDTIAKELGVARITVSRLKETFNMAVTNGVHKE